MSFCLKLKLEFQSFSAFYKSKWQNTKAELLQLNHTQFSSLGIFISKKVGYQKTKTTFIISVLKAVRIHGGPSFFDFQLFY